MKHYQYINSVPWLPLWVNFPLGRMLNIVALTKYSEIYFNKGCAWNHMSRIQLLCCHRVDQIQKAWVIMFKGRWELRSLYSSNEQMCPLLVLRQRHGNVDRGMRGGYNPQPHMHMECEVYFEERHLTRIVPVLDIVLIRLLGRRMRPAIIAGL